jgi:hypothetical protein
MKRHRRRATASGADSSRPCQVHERAVWTALIVVDAARFHLRLGVGADRNCGRFRHSSRKPPLNASMKTFCTGLPRRMNSS